MDIHKFFFLSESLASLTRYSQATMSRPESVLEHTGFVTLFCYLITQEVNSVAGYQLVKLETVLSKAVVHDMEEVITGDMPRPTKYSSPEVRGQIELLERKGINRLITELGYDELEIGSKIYNDWCTSKQDHSGTIVAMADLAAVCYKIWYEVLVRHNHSMVKHAFSLSQYLDALEFKIQTQFRGHPAVVALLTSLIASMGKIAVEASQLDRKVYGTIKE